ncbi:MAG: outer membrane protein assembly factor BamA, partial [Pseudomonadota bacterium]|nr:outer membrane protein assembly factor BamA [Pseudomonadota bacterium]
MKVSKGPLMRRVIAALLFMSITVPVLADMPKIAGIEVLGSQRIETATVLSYLGIAPGDDFDSGQVNKALKALFKTGLFADIGMDRDGDTLIVTVVENPVINRIEFEGNKRIKDDALLPELTLRPRVVYTRARVVADVERVQEIYRRSGRFSAIIEPKIVELDQNRVDLIFEIDEGPLTKVRSIRFVGNRSFSDSDLEDVVTTREGRWWRFLTSSDTYDPDRVAYDRELMRRFYLSKGYADFRVVCAVAELTENKDAFFLTFTVEEGEPYTFGKVDVQSTIADLDPESLSGDLPVVSDARYNADKIEETIALLTDRLANMQYAFVEIDPKAERDRENHKIDIAFVIDEGPRVFVERI